MATVQMPDGQLVELPNDADDALKEKIRQKVEAIRSQQAPQPQGGSPTPTPAPPTASSELPPIEIGPSGYAGRGEFAPEAGAESAPIVTSQAQDPLAQVSKGVFGAAGSMVPTSLGQVMQMLTLPRPSEFESKELPESAALGEAWRGEHGLEEQAKAITGSLLQAAPLAHLPFAESPLRATPRDLSLVKAFRTLSREPESPTPLSDAATKEAENASEITSGAGLDLRQQGTGVGEETPLRQQGEIAPTRQEIPTEPAAQVGGSGQQVTPPTLSTSDLPNHAQGAIQAASRATFNGKPGIESSQWARETVPIASLKPGNEMLFDKPSTFQPRTSQSEGPIVVDKTGEIIDGNNRVYEALGRGETHIDVFREKPTSETAPAPVAKLLPGETQGDLLSSTQPEPLALVGEKGVDYGAIQKAEEKAKQEGDISGLEGYALGAAGTKEIPIRGWKEMLESGEQTPVETVDSIARAKGQIGKVVDAVGGAFRNLRDFLTVNPIPKLERAGLSDAAYEHASARNSVVHSVRHLLSRVFPDEYKNPAAMQRTGDILTKDNILGVYDQAKERLDAAEEGTPEHEAATEAVNKIEEAHNLSAYDRDVSDAANDPKVSKNIERWKTWVNPEMDRMYNEIKSLDPWTIQESRGRHFGARINLLPLNQSAELAKFTDMSHGMPDLVTSNYRNPNIKADPFMRRAAGTGQYSTDPGLILTNSLARRYNEVTKLRFYNAVEKTGNGFIADAGVRPTDTEGLVRLAIKMPETNPATGLTRPVEKSLWIKNDLAREARDVLNTDMSAPSNPVFKALTQLQLLQLADATAHMKNIHTVVANSLGASKPWQDAVRKLPFLATADTVGRIASVVREVAADTPAIRDEIAQMAKQGMIRPEYPSTGIQRVTKMQDAIHHVDTASRIVMNRFWDNLAERGFVTDTPAARRQFVQRIGEYNGRLMGHFARTFRNYGASPFVVAGRTFNAFSKRLLLGDPGFKAASPQAAALARSYQLTGLALATTLPAIINYVITGNFGGRPGTPIGAIDTGTNNEKGDKKIIDLFQLMGIRRGLRSTGLGAVTEGLREGKSFNEIGGKAIEDITSTASHPWIGPGLGALYSGISGKRLDLRGGAWPYAAKQVKEGGLKQYGENLRVTLKNQNPLLYGLVSPLVGETEDTYGQGLARGLLKAPASAVGYIEKPGDSAFSSKREKQSSGVKVKP